jgi:hypothetical protein
MLICLYIRSLAIVNNEDLKDMGINAVGTRKEILAQTITLKSPLMVYSRSVTENLNCSNVKICTQENCKFYYLHINKDLCLII